VVSPWLSSRVRHICTQQELTALQTFYHYGARIGTLAVTCTSCQFLISRALRVSNCAPVSQVSSSGQHACTGPAVIQLQGFYSWTHKTCIDDVSDRHVAHSFPDPSGHSGAQSVRLGPGVVPGTTCMHQVSTHEATCASLLAATLSEWRVK
jgi:hypothetical protein